MAAAVDTRLPMTSKITAVMRHPLSGIGFNGSNMTRTAGNSSTIKGSMNTSMVMALAVINITTVNLDCKTCAAGWLRDAAGSAWTLLSISTVEPALGTFNQKIWKAWTR